VIKIHSRATIATMRSVLCNIFVRIVGAEAVISTNGYCIDRKDDPVQLRMDDI
jgi:hypothetical protein